VRVDFRKVGGVVRVRRNGLQRAGSAINVPVPSDKTSYSCCCRRRTRLRRTRLTYRVDLWARRAAASPAGCSELMLRVHRELRVHVYKFTSGTDSCACQKLRIALCVFAKIIVEHCLQQVLHVQWFTCWLQTLAYYNVST